MITSAISSAARLSLAPAKLAGQMAGALLRGLRGQTSRETSSAHRSARSTSARRNRSQAHTKRASTRSSGKRQPKRAAAGARGKGNQPSAERPKRTATRRGEAQPKRAARTEPLGDRAITREVESTIFRDLEADRGQVDVEVTEGVVRLRGEVGTPDLIRELEARAAHVPQVRRVENLLRTPAPPPQPATPAAQQVDPSSIPEEPSAAPAPATTVGPTSLMGVARGAEAPSAESAAGARAPRTGRWGDQAEPPTGVPGGTLEPGTRRPEGGESPDAEQGNAEPDKESTPSPGTGGQRGPQGS